MNSFYLHIFIRAPSCLLRLKQEQFHLINNNKKKMIGMGIALSPRRLFHRVACIHLPPPETENHDATGDVIQLIKCDGGVVIYEWAVKVREVMEEFPKHMVCHSDCFFIGQKAPALSGDHRLQKGQCYFLLPAIFSQSAVSFVTFIRYMPNFQVEMTPSGKLRIKETKDTTHQQEKMKDESSTIRVCTTPKLRREYDQLVGRRHSWRPKLDTIAETMNGGRRWKRC